MAQDGGFMNSLYGQMTGSMFSSIEEFLDFMDYLGSS